MFGHGGAPGPGGHGPGGFGGHGHGGPGPGPVPGGFGPMGAGVPGGMPGYGVPGGYYGVPGVPGRGYYNHAMTSYMRSAYGMAGTPAQSSGQQPEERPAPSLGQSLANFFYGFPGNSPDYPGD